MHKIFFCLLLLCPVFVKSQANTVSKKSEAYFYARQKITIPPFGTKKFSTHLQAMPFVGMNASRKKQFYLSLSLREKFTYNMIYPESFMQNCSIPMASWREEEKLNANLPNALSDFGWSQNQLEFFVQNCDSVKSFLHECLLNMEPVGLNVKKIIVHINAWELVPVLLKKYEANKIDHDILTVMVLLMKENKYLPFISSTLHSWLYGPDANFNSYIYLSGTEEVALLRMLHAFADNLFTKE